MGVFAGLRQMIRSVAVAAGIALCASQGAEARGPVLASVDAVKIGTYDNFTRVVMHVSVPLSPKLFTLSGPDRLIIDLPRIGWNMPRPSGAVRSRLIHSYRFGLLTPNVSRLVFNLNGPAQIVDFKVTPLVGKVGYELDIRLGEPVPRPFDRYRLAHNQTVRADGTPIPGADRAALPEAPVVDDETRNTFRQRSFNPQTAEYGALSALFADNSPTNPEPKPVAEPEKTAGQIAAEITEMLTRPARIADVDAAEAKTVEAKIAETDIAEAAPQAAAVATVEPSSAPGIAPSSKVTVMAMAAPTVLLPPEKAIRKSEKPRRKPFRIVIDPGHGGHDPGAVTPVGLHESDAVLSFSEVLMALLEADPHYKAYATRRHDHFVELPDRVTFAREKQADLFISIHADWFDDPAVGGAGAFMLSEEDSIRSIDELVTKKRAEKIAGIDIREEREDVVRVLLDLERRETQVGSRLFAELVRDKLSLVTPVKRNFVKHNNFHVLKAPDMPSVLLELGFMSNPDDLKRLTSAEWRKTTAVALKEAIDAWRIEHSAREIASR